MNRRWIGVAMAVAVMTIPGCTSKTGIPAAAHTGLPPSKRPLTDLMLTTDQLPLSLAGWTVAPSLGGDVIVAVPNVTCSSLFTDVTWLGVKATAHAASRILPSDSGELSKWHGQETMARYSGNATQAMQAIRDLAARCTADPGPAGPGANAVVAAGPTLGDDSLELTVHLSLADDPDSYMADEFVVIRSGQDLIVVEQHLLVNESLDPATTRLLAAAAYTAYQRQP
jgi:hypothetical protein